MRCLARMIAATYRLPATRLSRSATSTPSHAHEFSEPSGENEASVVPMNVLAIGQLHSSPMLVRSCLKACILGFSIIQTKNFQISKLGLEKEEELVIKLPTFAGL